MIVSADRRRTDADGLTFVDSRQTRHAIDGRCDVFFPNDHWELDIVLAIEGGDQRRSLSCCVE